VIGVIVRTARIALWDVQRAAIAFAAKIVRMFVKIAKKTNAQPAKQCAKYAKNNFAYHAKINMWPRATQKESSKTSIDNNSVGGNENATRLKKKTTKTIQNFLLKNISKLFVFQKKIQVSLIACHEKGMITDLETIAFLKQHEANLHIKQRENVEQATNLPRALTQLIVTYVPLIVHGCINDDVNGGAEVEQLCVNLQFQETKTNLICAACTTKCMFCENSFHFICISMRRGHSMSKYSRNWM